MATFQEQIAAQKARMESAEVRAQVAACVNCVKCGGGQDLFLTRFDVQGNFVSKTCRACVDKECEEEEAEVAAARAREPPRPTENELMAALKKWEDEGHKDSDWEAVLALAPWADQASLDFREAHERGWEDTPWAEAEYVACRHCGSAPLQERISDCPVYGWRHYI